MSKLCNLLETLRGRFNIDYSMLCMASFVDALLASKSYEISG